MDWNLAQALDGLPPWMGWVVVPTVLGYGAATGGNMLQRAIVVGASSGMGAALVRQLVQQGYHVAAVARRASVLERVCEEADRAVAESRCFPVVHDVTDVDGARAAFDEAVARMDGLDLIVYSAGVMPTVGPDQFDTELDKRIVEVNVTGAMAWLNLAADRFQVQGSGVIVGIGSVAGDRGRRGNPAYCASKAALHTYLEALRNRLSQHGVRVVTIKPGPVDTPMTAGRDRLPLLIDADRAASGILAAVRGGPDTRYVPAAWWPIMSAVRSVPSLLFRRMNF